jgi:hypothetical protein
MTSEEQTAACIADLQVVVNRYVHEFDMPVAHLIGALTTVMLAVAWTNFDANRPGRTQKGE